MAEKPTEIKEVFNKFLVGTEALAYQIQQLTQVVAGLRAALEKTGKSKSGKKKTVHVSSSPSDSKITRAIADLSLSVKKSVHKNKKRESELSSDSET